MGRTVAWLNRRRLAKDWERPRTGSGQGLGAAKDWERMNHDALAVLKWASLRLMVRKRRPTTT